MKKMLIIIIAVIALVYLYVWGIGAVSKLRENNIIRTFEDALSEKHTWN